VLATRAVTIATGAGGPNSWRGQALSVDVLHSVSGVATQILVGFADRSLLVDVGDGCLRDLLARDHDLGGLAALVFTHGHYDHIGGLHSLLGFLRARGRTQPLTVIGPRGCAELWSSLDTFQRCYPDSVPFGIARTQLEAGDTVAVGQSTLTAFGVVHSGSILGGKVLDAIPALGYRLGFGGETVAFTGDTGKCDSLTQLVSGADLAVIEATLPNSAGVAPELLERVHLSTDLAHELGKLAKHYLLVHQRRQG